MDRKEKDMPKFFHLPDDDVSAPEEEVGRSKTATIRNIAERNDTWTRYQDFPGFVNSVATIFFHISMTILPKRNRV